MKRILDFLKEAQTYYLATADGDQPRVRPFGTVNLFDGKLCIQTGRSKDVAKQILANPKVELCAMRGNEWIRVAGVLKEDPRVEAKRDMLDHYPSLRSMYSEDDPNTLVLFFESGKATISAFGRDPVEIDF